MRYRYKNLFNKEEVEIIRALVKKYLQVSKGRLNKEEILKLLKILGIEGDI